MAFVSWNLTKADSSPVVSNNVRGTKVGRKGDGEEEDEESFSRLLLTHHTLRSHSARVGYPRFKDDWRWFREESKYKMIETFVIAAFLWGRKPFCWFRFQSEPFVWILHGIIPSLKMFMHVKSAGFLIISLTKDARCKLATNSYALHVILTPWLLNFFSLPFLPKKSILGNLFLTIFFLLSWRTPETRLLEGIFFEVTQVCKPNIWPFWFNGQGWRNITTMDYKGPFLSNLLLQVISIECPK